MTTDHTTYFSFQAIGTTWVIDLNARLLPQQEADLLDKIRSRIDQFDAAYSRFRSDSIVSNMARSAGVYLFPEDIRPMIELYHHLYKITGGTVTPLIGQVLVDAGYNPTYSLQPKTLQRPPTWEETLEYKAPAILITKQPVQLDFGALGKGYLIDLIGDLLWNEGFRTFCVEAGGDMIQRNSDGEALRVGLEHPENPTEAIGVATLLNMSLCGSAGNRRRWDKYHHIMNPHTLNSPMEILAVWVVAKTTLLADAMTTALFFCEPETLLKMFEFEYVMMFADHSVKMSARFPGEVFIG